MSSTLTHLALSAANYLGAAQTPLLNAQATDRMSVATLPAPSADSFEISPVPPPPPNLGAPSASRAFASTLMAGAVVALAPASALAQSPGVEAAAAFATHLPPTWQMLVGGLLYAEPALRMVSRAIRRVASWFARPQTPAEAPAAAPQSLVQQINLATGKVERVLGPVRDVVAPVFIGAQALFPDRPITSFWPEAIALGLSIWNYHDRTGRVEKAIVKNQLDSDQRLLPAGWRSQEARALGVLAPDVPKAFPPEHLAGDEPPPYAQGAKPGFSVWRNLRVLGTTVSMLTGLMRRTHVYLEGTHKTFLSWKESVRPGRHAPVSQKYLKAVDIMLPQWVMRVCEGYGISLSFKDMDRLKLIPKGAPVVFAAFPHSAIYTDFLFWHALPRARFVADKKNFHDARAIRGMGLAWFLDVIGLPFVSRDKSKSNGAVNSRASSPPLSSIPPAKNGSNGSNSQLYDQTTQRMMDFDIQPVFFPQAGRAPRAYRDDRTLGRAGLYANVVDLKRPERYYNLIGTINTALAAAKKAGRDAYIPILHIEGSGRVMPKVSKNPPFIQPVQPGEIAFSVGEVVRVTPASTLDEVTPQVIEAAKRVTGINEFLRREIKRWAEAFDLEGAPEDFATVAASDETYYIVADRIRSVHPNLSQRNEFKRRLLTAARRAARGDDVGEDLNALLHEVSRLVKETEYQRI